MPPDDDRGMGRLSLYLFVVISVHATGIWGPAEQKYPSYPDPLEQYSNPYPLPHLSNPQPPISTGPSDLENVGASMSSYESDFSPVSAYVPAGNVFVFIFGYLSYYRELQHII